MWRTMLANVAIIYASYECGAITVNDSAPASTEYVLTILASSPHICKSNKRHRKCLHIVVGSARALAHRMTQDRTKINPNVECRKLYLLARKETHFGTVSANRTKYYYPDSLSSNTFSVSFRPPPTRARIQFFDIRHFLIFGVCQRRISFLCECRGIENFFFFLRNRQCLGRIACA